MLGRVPVAGHAIVADKGFAGREFEQRVEALGGRLLRPDRKDEPHRHGSLTAVRQWIEAVFGTCKSNSVSNATALAR